MKLSRQCQLQSRRSTSPFCQPVRNCYRYYSITTADWWPVCGIFLQSPAYIHANKHIFCDIVEVIITFPHSFIFLSFLQELTVLQEELDNLIKKRQDYESVSKIAWKKVTTLKKELTLNDSLVILLLWRHTLHCEFPLCRINKVNLI